jgi:predicted DNA-binding transcriptional regulator AlpA
MRIIHWPEGVAEVVGVSVPHLQHRRSLGDCPRLYAVTERRLVTTDADIAAWVTGKEVPASYKCRTATRGTINGGSVA